MSIFEQGVSELREDEFELSGTISLSMPSDTGRGVLAPLIDRFIELHQKLACIFTYLMVMRICISRMSTLRYA
ncbi:hypothetical protein JCM19231_3150 [Vibrio ishigakensis]|uniref:Uncharacterized protein n=1 Tax=Vibrio ishigakensis TaxID=1481914 RepID=A0A0B8NS23_9VIBR|nr:hypothetical protein JCM19231_3150 [Vibrio ishigakensis]